MVRSQVRLKSIFWRLLTFLKSAKVEVPSAHTLTELISQETKQHKGELTETIEARLSREQRGLLDAVLEKEISAENIASAYQRYKLTLLKSFSQSTKPTKIKSNIHDLQILGELYGKLETVVEALDLTQEGLRYHAQAVIKSQVFQIARRSEEDRYLHLLCFVAHQFFRLHDTLLDVHLTCVQNTLNACEREHKQLHYEERFEQRRSIKSFVETVQQGACVPLEQIERIVFCEAFSADEKVCRIQDVLTAGEQQLQSAQSQITQFQDRLAKSSDDAVLIAA